MPHRVLITGGNGFVGGNLAVGLAERHTATAAWLRDNEQLVASTEP